MLTALAFVFTLGLLVTVHEYGHFLAAKWCGVKVLKFSIGFGKPLWSKKIGLDQTEFVLAAIPLGGFVKMLDEREFEQDANSQMQYSEAQLEHAFNRQSVVKRIFIVLAGPLANLLLAIFLYWVLFMIGIVGMKPVLGDVLEHSPASVAQLKRGETIQKINGRDIATWQEVSWILLNESFENTSVEIQAISNNQQVHKYQLSLSNLNQDNPSKDILTLLGLSMHQPDIPARIGDMIKNSPADLAGLKTNDLVLMIGDTKVSTWEDFVEVIRLHANDSLAVLVLRNSEKIKLTVRPEPAIENDKTIGRIGAAPRMEQSDFNKIYVTRHYSVAESLIKASEKTWDTAIFSLEMLGRMVTGQVSWKGMSGPVTIADYAGQSANMGIRAFISFLALISISIGVLNLLPIPVLDGGHLMYYVVEILTGKPVSDSVMIVGQKIGILLLSFLMIIAFYNDINRLITG